jgi:hypothetical protein
MEELFSRVQLVVKDIIETRECLTVTGLQFYTNLLSKSGFVSRQLIRHYQPEIITTFDEIIEGIRDTEPEKLAEICDSATDENVNKLISLFLKGNKYEDKWKNYLTRGGRGRRKTRRRNKNRTKKVRRKPKSMRKNVKKIRRTKRR